MPYSVAQLVRSSESGDRQKVGTELTERCRYATANNEVNLGLKPGEKMKMASNLQWSLCGVNGVKRGRRPRSETLTASHSLEAKEQAEQRHHQNGHWHHSTWVEQV